MCGSSNPAPPKAAPSPVPMADANRDALANKQKAARRAGSSGYQSTQLSNPASTEDQISGGRSILGA